MCEYHWMTHKLSKAHKASFVMFFLTSTWWQKIFKNELYSNCRTLGCMLEQAHVTFVLYMWYGLLDLYGCWNWFFEKTGDVSPRCMASLIESFNYYVDHSYFILNRQFYLLSTFKPNMQVDTMPWLNVIMKDGSFDFSKNTVKYKMQVHTMSWLKCRHER